MYWLKCLYDQWAVPQPHALDPASPDALNKGSTRSLPSCVFPSHRNFPTLPLLATTQKVCCRRCPAVHRRRCSAGPQHRGGMTGGGAEALCAGLVAVQQLQAREEEGGCRRPFMATTRVCTQTCSTVMPKVDCLVRIRWQYTCSWVFCCLKFSGWIQNHVIY